jgi:hypothetical protein
MFGLFKKQSPEVSVLLERIDAATKRLPFELHPIGEPLLSRLAQTVRTQWKEEHKKNYNVQIKEGETHEAFIYNFLVHSVGDLLESGRFHVYRGVLNAEGILYKQLFEHAIGTMIEMGGYTDEWANANLRAAVYKGIKEVG